MILETVRRARIRIIANQTIRYGVWAASAALASLIALLLAGTQILDWQWLLVLPSVSIAAGCYLTWRGAPSLYRTAQHVDRNLKLADTLSTALYFSGDARAPEQTRQAQWALAERTAAGLDLRRGIPLRMPGAAYTAALLAVAAASLFALRYGLDRRLDLSAPLARMVAEHFGYPQVRQAARDPHQPAPEDRKRPGETATSLQESQQKDAGELDPATDAALDSPGVPDVDKAGSRPDGSKLEQSTPLETGENQGAQAEGVNANPGNQDAGGGKQGMAPGKPGQADAKQGTGDSGQNSGLLSKFRDAMSSLLNRVRQRSGGQGGQQQAGMQGQQKSQQSGAGQNGKQGSQPGEGQKADGQEGQQGEDSQNAQNAQAGSPGESGQQPATKQPGSGIGRQDGSKDIKLAEQLAAMGKISEIIGKRAANVSGEMTVEVQNSNQQLRTPYTQSSTRHADAGGEIHRDEVPVSLEAYVQQYFEQVRKQAPAGAGSRAHRHTESSKPGL